jgi:arylsulfatase A-like enzyme
VSLGVTNHATPDTVAPPRLAEQLLTPFRTQTSDAALFERLIPGPLPKKPADAVLEPFGYLRASADVDERTFQAALAVLKRNPKQPFLAVYIVGVDSAEHAFWQYRFPGDFPSNPPSPEDVKRFGAVIDRYVEFVDEQLKKLLASYEEEPNIVIVSDHGHGAALEFRGWRGWHHKEGVFLAAGPSVSRNSDRISVSYYDIVPTLLSFEGIRQAGGAHWRIAV